MMASTLKDRLWTDMRIDVTVEEAQSYLDKFFTTYPGVERYIKHTQGFASAFKLVHTFLGRRRRFPYASYNHKTISRVSRQAVNARIQSTSSDIVGMNLVSVDNAIRDLGGRCLLTVHDSIVFQLPKGTPNVKALLDNAIVEETKKRCPWLPVEWKYDCAYGPSYGEAKTELTDDVTIKNAA